MPEITVTETQEETLEEVRSDLQAAYIDTYGQMRTKDAVQYLLDTYTPPEQQSGDVAHERIATAEFPLLQQIAADVEEVPGSGIDTATMRGELLSALGVEEFAARLAELDSPEETHTAPAETDTEAPESEDETDTSPDEPSPTAESEAADAPDTAEVETSDDGDSEADTAEAETSDDGDSGADTADSSASTGGPGAGGSSSSILSAANQLLTNHDDKWREGSGQEPYEVDLPDGSTQEVRTKDDVRQLLFKHY